LGTFINNKLKYNISEETLEMLVYSGCRAGLPTAGVVSKPTRWELDQEGINVDDECCKQQGE